MFTAKQFRAKAAESAESIKHTDVPSEIREFQRSKESFNALAENEDWLANNFDKIIRSQDIASQKDDAEKPIADVCRRNRGAHSSLPRRGRHHAMEHHPNETPARTLRHRRLNGRRDEIGGVESTNCPLPASAQG
jgi:hypothetical protein